MLGILSITCLWIAGSIPAIILGLIALKKIGEFPATLQGKGFAVAGLITGGVGVFAGLIPIGIAASLVLPVFTQVSSRAQQTVQTNEMRQISLACHSYAADNNGKFPKKLKQLHPDYLSESDILKWDDKATGETLPYLYRGSLSSSSPSTEPMMLSPNAIAGKRVVLYVEGNVAVLDQASVEEILPLFE